MSTLSPSQAKAPARLLVRDSHISLHRQIAQRLRESIAAGTYKAGDRIPTESQLIAQYGVSRITVRQAVLHLAREGVVIRKKGKGTYVGGPVVHHDLLQLRGIYDALVAGGHNPQTKLLSFGEVQPPARVGQRLRTGTTPLVSWCRLYLLGGKPFAVSWAHLAPARSRITRDDAGAHPMYELVEKLLHWKIDRADISIRYGTASAQVRKHLRLPAGSPIMALERVSYCSEGIPREHTVYFAKAAAYEFSLTVRGKLPITQSLREAA